MDSGPCDSSSSSLLRSTLHLALALAMLALTSTAANAQAVYGSVSGIVRDSTGALLPGNRRGQGSTASGQDAVSLPTVKIIGVRVEPVSRFSAG